MAEEEGRQDFLATRGDEDLPVKAVVGGLVLARPMDPHLPFTGQVLPVTFDIARTHVAYLADPGAGEELKLNHRPYLPRDERPDGVDLLDGHGLDGLGFGACPRLLRRSGTA